MISESLATSLAFLALISGTDVDAPSARVGVVGDFGPEAVAEVLDLGDVLGQVLRRHGGVFDERDRLVVARLAHEQTQPDLADGPDVVLPLRLDGRRDGRGPAALALEMPSQLFDLRPELRFARAGEFGDEDAVGQALDEGLQQARVFEVLPAPHEPLVVHELNGRSGPPPGSWARRLARRRAGRNARWRARSAAVWVPG